MSGSITEVVVAVVGIGGTLASALLTQLSANRVRLREVEKADEQRTRELDRTAREAGLEARRACYAGLNAAALDYVTVLDNFSYAVEAGRVTDDLRAELYQARRAHRSVHADAQMLLSASVMVAADRVGKSLGQVYRMLKRLDGGTPEAGDDIATARQGMATLWDHLWVMRRDMRRDLGLGDDA
ncbi:hypothetical protein ACGF5F_15180 [Streptomyces sp. NPDC047821]|uniref:hypothetical protein n=1 Tax=unclassified Streptomyces TaxID=2593676 RepID=UPI003627FCF9